MRMKGFQLRHIGVLAVMALAITPAQAQDGRPQRPGSGPVVAPTGPIAAPNAPIRIVRREIVPPAGGQDARAGGRFILGPAAVSEELRSLPVRRQLSLANLRSQPVIQLTRAQVDFGPMLRDPNAPFNVAQALRARTDLADVTMDETTTYEITNRGYIVHSLISYSIKPGVCADTNRRTALEQAGGRCPRMISDAAAEASIDDPASPRFAPRERRGAALQQLRTSRQQQRTQMTSVVAQARTVLNNPAQRDALVARFGAAEVERLRGLGDEALAGEIASGGVRTIERTFFIPLVDNYAPGFANRIQPAGGGSGPNGGTVQPASPATPPPPPPAPIDYAPTTVPLERHVFLAGFTMGREYEWRERVEVTIPLCFLGCEETFYIEAWVKFGYGFGLRFPMEMTGTYTYEGRDRANVLVNFAPFNGDVGDYIATGLPAEQLFAAKEAVAEIGFGAGFKYRVPILGSNTFGFDEKLDLTSQFPAPFTDGQFTPPAANSSTPRAVRVFGFDLLGQRVNLGILGATVKPMVGVSLEGKDLTFRLSDRLAGGAPRAITTGSRHPLRVAATDQSSSFTLGDPTYTLVFVVTPGIRPHVFLNTFLWETGWSYDLWMPQLSIELPPGGLTFACHDGTQCRRDYAASPTGVTSMEGAADLEQRALRALGDWVRNVYEPRWLPECSDQVCRAALRWIAVSEIAEMAERVHLPFDGWLMQQLWILNNDVPTGLPLHRDQALRDSRIRYRTAQRQAWLAACYDQPCRQRVTQLWGEIEQWEEAALQNPSARLAQVRSGVESHFIPQLQAVVDASYARANPIRGGG